MVKWVWNPMYNQYRFGSVNEYGFIYVWQIQPCISSDRPVSKAVHK